MQIIIPMSGFGERFRKAGYNVPKPLIKVDEKTIIEHVIDLFPGESDFLFICNQDHLDNPDYRMREILLNACPTGKIMGIPAHKLGPVHAVMQCLDEIDNDQPVIVNYCDFSCYWDYSYFKDFVLAENCDGAVPAYKGFHPHSLGTTNYAYIKHSDMRMQAIKEKEPFTDNRINEFASSGTYYFRSGALMKEAFADCVAQDHSINGEFYVSLAYLPLLEKGCDIRVYELAHFMQWGTPQDLEEYQDWASIFESFGRPKKQTKLENHALIIPLAGLGSRFAKEGYSQIKPLINVKNIPMVLAAVNDMPPVSHHVFVMRRDMPDLQNLIDIIKSKYPNALIEILETVTEGQALTCKAGVEALKKAQPDFDGRVSFCACDNGVVYDDAALSELVLDDAVDVIAWGVRGYSNARRSPEMFGWIDEDNGNVISLSVKKPLSNPDIDPVFIGAATFKNLSLFDKCLESLIARDGRVNNEFYLDSMINDALDLGLRATLFEVDYYLSWGTPNELRTFEYWEGCFTKWSGHNFNGFKKL